MVLQESLEAGYKADYLTDDGGIHPDFPAEVGVSEPRPPNFIAAIPQTSAGADSAAATRPNAGKGGSKGAGTK